MPTLSGGAGEAPAAPRLTLRKIVARTVAVPVARPLVTRIVTIDRVPLVLLDIHCEEGVSGHTYVFGYSRRGCAHIAALLRDIAELVQGERVAPVRLWHRVRKALTLMGHQGLTATALSAFDCACWDALARAAGLPLAALLGGGVESVRAYNSNGLGLIGAQAAAEEAQQLIDADGFEAVKLRLGRPRAGDDLDVVRAVRKAVGDDVLVPVDYNQCLSVSQAIERGRQLDGEGVYWIEEPIVYDDFAGSARVAREVATPIQTGENLYGPSMAADAIAAQASDLLMFDVMRIGGVTGWLRAAALADNAGMEVSSHLFPEVSCHLLSVTPTSHWLEYVDWAAPILAEPLRVEAGRVPVPEAPGTGIAWDEAAVAAYAFEP